MMYIDPTSGVLLPAVVSVSHDTARLLNEMAREMGVSLDELFSAFAEDAVIGLENGDEDVFSSHIPERISRESLLKLLNERLL